MGNDLQRAAAQLWYKEEANKVRSRNISATTNVTGYAAVGTVSTEVVLAACSKKWFFLAKKSGKLFGILEEITNGSRGISRRIAE